MTEPFDAEKFVREVTKGSVLSSMVSEWKIEVARQAYERGRNDGLEEAAKWYDAAMGLELKMDGIRVLKRGQK